VVVVAALAVELVEPGGGGHVLGAGADPEEQVRRFQATRGHATVFERTRPNGRIIEVRQNPVAGGGFVLIYADITERKRNEAEIRSARDAAEEASRTIEAAFRELKAAQANLIQAEKMASLGQLTAGIAHEIKNPLNFVNNFSALSAELIDELREVLAPEPLGETVRAEVEDLTALLKGNLEKVVQHGQRADGIVKAMLEHSRGSSGERRMVDLNALIDGATVGYDLLLCYFCYFLAAETVCQRSDQGSGHKAR
jgi:two-component system NtrC family sensor kinase